MTQKTSENVTAGGKEDDNDPKPRTTTRGFVNLVPAILTIIVGILALSELLEESKGNIAEMSTYITQQIGEYQPHVISDRFSETLYNCDHATYSSHYNRESSASPLVV